MSALGRWFLLPRVVTMATTVLPLLWRLTIELAAGVAAGVANGIAGGGTFITFPTLLALGLPSLTANVTSSVGVLPSYVGGIRGFRAEIRTHASLLRTVIPPCVGGALVGCALLLLFPSSAFHAVVPWLVGLGTVLFTLSPLITKRLAHLRHDHPGRTWSLIGGMFLVAIYGGYFGAGLGILLLAVMAISLPYDIATLQGLRNVLSTIVNGAAAVVFITRSHLVWGAAGMLALGTGIGGLAGAALLKRLRPRTVRLVVVACGVATTVRLFWG